MGFVNNNNSHNGDFNVFSFVLIQVVPYQLHSMTVIEVGEDDKYCQVLSVRYMDETKFPFSRLFYEPRAIADI